MNEIPEQVLLAVVRQLIENAKITDETIINTFTVGFISGVRFCERSS